MSSRSSNRWKFRDESARVPVIRVGQVVRPAAGGIRRHVTSLLSGIDTAEFAATLFAPPDFDLDPRIMVTHIPIHIRARTSPLIDLRDIIALARLLRRRYDLVHAHGLRGALIGVTAARLARIPAIMTAHNLVPPSGRLSSGVLRWLGRNSTIIAVSRAVGASLSALGIHEDQIHVISNGVNLAEFEIPAANETTRRAYLAGLMDRARPPEQVELAGWLRDPSNLDIPIFVVAAVGRLAPEKGFDTLVAAFKGRDRAADRPGDPRRMLIIAGSGPQEKELARLAGGLPAVTLVGPLLDVAPLLNAADAVAVPSRTEGQGIVALEAMAAGRPVVAARVGGLVESVRDGETGILVPPGDSAALRAAFDVLIHSPALRQRMGAVGRQHAVQEYSLDRMVERTEALYRSTARNPL